MLNNQLYEALRREFGKVTVYSRGEAATYSVNRRTALDIGSRDWASDVKGGEHYEVTCPLCGMHKLWFSYLAGSVVEIPGERPVWFPEGLMICYYCQGMSSKEERDKVWAKLHNHGEFFHVKKREAFPEDGAWSFDLGGGSSGEGSDRPSVVFPDGVGISDPSVPAEVVEYLKSRDIDPSDLERECAACWCPDPTGNGIGRITFPVYRNGILVGWQGRALPRFCSKSVPKYWTCGSKANWLFNLDRARWFPFGVLVEGVFDCFRVGVQGVCRFGKTTSVGQLRMLVSTWGNQGLVILPDMNDPDALPSAVKEASQWNARTLFKDGVKVVRLPVGNDPGSLSHEAIAGMIREQTGLELK